MPEPGVGVGGSVDLLHDIRDLFQKNCVYQYRVEKPIGRGSYGVVFQAFDVLSGRNVAIKRVFPFVFKDTRLSQRMLRELCILAHFRAHPNVIRLLDVFRVPGPRPAPDTIFIVMDLADFDLKTLMESGPQLSEEHIKFFVYQLLVVLHCIHNNGVIHRDITPANILVDGNCDVKLSDFGLAIDQAAGDKTDYVCMRWYRAPELILEELDYTGSVDVWSLGCILAQLYSKNYQPVFPGQSSLDQLRVILEVLGSPCVPDEIDFITAEAARRYVCSFDYPRDYGVLRQRFQTPEAEPIDDLAFDLICRMLEFNPTKRITVEECLHHEYFQGLFEPNDLDVEIEPFQMAAYDRMELSEDVRTITRRVFEKVDELHATLAARAGAVGSSSSSSSSSEVSRATTQPLATPTPTLNRLSGVSFATSYTSGSNLSSREASVIFPETLEEPSPGIPSFASSSGPRPILLR